jgi:hypothetical protein
MTENTKWNFKNSRFLGKIEGKLYTLKQLIDPDQTLVIEKIDEIEELVKKIEL